jgi:multidrug efflux pump
MERDLYFQVAMLTTVGLSSKNAILIIAFAKTNIEHGMGLVEATMRAVRDRLRPILMTSLAFGFGVLPLALASGAGSGAQRAIGTGVLGGMVAGTALGLFFVPLFFVVVERVFDKRMRAQRLDAGPFSDEAFDPTGASASGVVPAGHAVPVESGREPRT